MTKQTQEDQAKRLANGCCPVHGLSMSQYSVWFTDETGDEYCYGQCPRRDCDIVAKFRTAFGQGYDVTRKDTVPRSGLTFHIPDQELERVEDHLATLVSRSPQLDPDLQPVVRELNELVHNMCIRIDSAKTLDAAGALEPLCRKLKRRAEKTQVQHVA